MAKTRFALGAGLVAIGLVVAVAPAAARVDERAAKPAPSRSAYIVRLVDQPAVAYGGGIAGLKATKPAKGQKLDPDSPAVREYASYLDGKHDAVLGKVGGGQKLYDYRYAFNGFSARLSDDQAAQLRKDDAVLSVEKTTEVTIDTATTPAFLGLTDPQNGLWSKGVKGEGVVIGVLDSGVWPENPSFSDRNAAGDLLYKPNPGVWHGRKCHPGEQWDASLCNQKLIGAQFFCASRGCDTVLEHEFLSPRDYNGHGSHTASTAGGNEGVATTGSAALFGSVNGIAPRARIAAYKVCWDNGAGGCGANTGDSVAAIDQAVADGVDVINYSISGTQTNYLDAVEVAYLFAADAGVFVATSAGNSGPTASTVAHVSPWLAAVAAGTHDRSGTGKVTLGNGASYNGASLTDAVGPAALVYAGAVKLPAAAQGDAELCFPGTLDPAKVTGKIVLCDRGVNARVEKSATVKSAGGVGMVLRNLTPSSLNADLHSIPTVHVDEVAGAVIKTYIDTAGAGATASLSQAVVTRTAPAPDVAAFSSRGPSIAGGGDILKPDFMLPGQDILAAVAPPGNAGKDFDIYSGTSMSSPHVAGAAALLTQAHPDWSPAAMRSAMATTADATSRVSLTRPFDVGSGHVRPNLMVDPGLVYDAGFNDYLAFLKGQRLCCASSASIPSLDASDLNRPSIAIGDLAGTQTVTRTVTNVGSTAATYTAAVTGLPGITAIPTPSSFTIAPGASQTFQVAFTRTTAALGTYQFGALTWSDGTHAVRSPLVIRPVAIAAPSQITAAGTSGSTSWTVKTGYVGPLNVTAQGLIPAQTAAGTVADDPTDNFATGNPTGNQGITTHDVTVPADATYLRVSLFDEFTDGDDDLDLYVYRVNGSSLILAGTSGGGTAAEEVNITAPVAGATYRVFVHGWQTDGPDASYTLFSWALGAAKDASTTVTGGGTAGIGTTFPISVGWTGLTGGTKYLGTVSYADATTRIGRTVVRVDG